MVGHQHPADEQKIQLVAHLVEPLDKATAKTLGEEKLRLKIGAGSDELQLTRAVNALVEGHAAGEYTLACPCRKRESLRESADPTERGLRQPTASVSS